MPFLKAKHEDQVAFEGRNGSKTSQEALYEALDREPEAHALPRGQDRLGRFGRHRGT